MNNAGHIDPERLVGYRIRHRYSLEELIGQGGMGCIYRAIDLDNGTTCAIKMFLPRKVPARSADTYQRFLERFNREFEIVDTARHPHIVQVFNRGEFKIPGSRPGELLSVAFFVMEYFPQRSLSDRIEKLQQISLQKTCQYIEQIADALDYIHAQQVIHRDIKPQNVLLDDEDNAILADFGVAHIAGSVLTLTDQPGTRVYKSPQAKRDEPPDTRDDIYSMGVMIYEMLTGMEPHIGHIRAMTPTNTLDVPAAIQLVIQKATEDERQDRYATAQELARSLRRATRANKAGNARGSPFRDRSSRQDAWDSPRKPGGPRNWFFPLLRLGLLLLTIPIGLGLFWLLQWTAIAHQHASAVTFPRTTVELATPIIEPQSLADELVLRYYQDWNTKQYEAAYSLLQLAYQQKHAFTDLLTFYQHTQRVCIAVTQTTIQTDGSIQVWITDNAIEEVPSGATIVSLYSVEYDVRQEQEHWRLAPIFIQRMSTPGSCH